MDRTFGGNLHQLGALICRQRPSQFDPDIDPIEQSFLGLAGLAILRVDARMRQGNCNVLQRKLFAARLEPDRHRRACSQRH